MSDLEERVDELEAENRRLNALVDAQRKKMNRIVALLIGSERDFGQFDVQMVENIWDQIDDLDERLDLAEQDVATALATSQARSDGGEPTKKEIALRETRNELVRKAATGTGKSDGVGVTASDVQQMGRPKVELAYQTVKDAWHELAQRWDAIVVTNGEDGTRRAKLMRDEVTRELVAVVEDDLGRDDLTKRLISRKTTGEGSA
jgi:hypothetical protein